MNILDGIASFTRATPSGTPSPRNDSPRTGSPRAGSSRATSPRHSPRCEDPLTNFAKSKMPGTLHLVQRGQESLYFKLIEKTFQLLNDLQFHCLPLKYRSLGIKHYIAAETEKKRQDMESLYNSWLDKEQLYIEELVGPLDDLTAEQEELIPRIRQSIFTALYIEQDERKKQDPFQPFVSICGISGQKNASYHASMMQAKMQQQSEKSFQDKIRKTGCYFEEFFQKKTINPAKLSAGEKQAALAAKIAITEARLKASYDEPQNCPSGDITFQFQLLATMLRGSSFAANLSNWEEIHAQYEAAEVKLSADKKWSDYSKREEAVFEELHGFAISTFSAKEKTFYSCVRTAIYRVIYEEQASGLPFHSICDKAGELNEEYWIDRLDALAKKNKETPLEDPHPLKHYTDYDVLRTNTAPPKTKADGITDDSRLRTQGAVTPDFCASVLASIKQCAKQISQKAAGTQQALFNSTAITTEEKIIFLLNEYCETLAHTHYIRGLTQTMLTKMNIRVALVPPSLSGMTAGPLRLSRKSDADKTPGLLRKMSGSLVEKKLGLDSPLQLRKSPIPDAGNQQAAQSEPEFEKECRLFQEELKTARKYVKLITDERIAGADEALEYFRIYAISLQVMANDLKTLSNMLQAFATSLQAQGAARQERHSVRGGSQSRRNSSMGIRPRSRPLLTESTFEPPLRTRSVSLMTKTIPMLSHIKSPEVAAGSPDLSPPDSPRIADMNPEKFTQKASALLQLHHLFIEVHDLIAAEVEKASGTIQETNLTKQFEDMTL